MRIQEITSPRPGEKLHLVTDLEDILTLKTEYQTELDIAARNLHMNQEKDPEAYQQAVEKYENAKKQYTELIDQLRDINLGDLNDLPKVAKLFDTIRSECKETIIAMKRSGKYMYRGMQHAPSYAFAGNSRSHRRTKDSHYAASELFNWCLAELGFTARRDNSIFCTSDSDLAVDFGELYIIFPRDGKSSYTYTTESDLTIERTTLNEKGIVNETKLNKIVAFFNNDFDPETDVELELKNEIDKGAWNLIMALQEYAPTVNEVAARYDINLDWKELIDLNRFKQIFKPNNTDLASALVDGVEIYVRGEYFALNRNHFQSLVDRFLI